MGIALYRIYIVRFTALERLYGPRRLSAYPQRVFGLVAVWLPTLLCGSAHLNFTKHTDEAVRLCKYAAALVSSVCVPGMLENEHAYTAT